MHGTVNDSNLYSKLFQDSFIGTFIKLTQMYSEIVQNYYIFSPEPGKFQKYYVVRVLLQFIAWDKVIEHALLPAYKLKWTSNEQMADLCESNIQKRRAFLKWTFEIDLLAEEDLSKHYYQFENQSTRLCSQYYSETSMNNYIRFHSISLDVSIDRMNYLFEIKPNAVNEDPSFLVI
jgi:hypothetical protein